LRGIGHDATRVGAEHPGGISDLQVLILAKAEGRVLITDNRDFGDLVFRSRMPHAGVIYLRLGSYAPLATKIARLDYALTHHAVQLDQFLVVTLHKLRVRH
jgi:predicted nuclease of predicted toxin-antitoxin system